MIEFVSTTTIQCKNRIPLVRIQVIKNGANEKQPVASRSDLNEFGRRRERSKHTQFNEREPKEGALVG